MLEDQTIAVLIIAASNITCLSLGILIGRLLWKKQTRQW